MPLSNNAFRVKADRPDWRDYNYSFARNPNPRQAVDLRPWCSPVEDQLHLGSCVGQAVVGAFELMINKLYPEKFVDLSRLFVYYNARALDNAIYEDVGAYTRDGIKAVNKWGVCNELIWPYIIDRFAFAPSIQSYSDAKNRLIKNYYRVNTLDDMIDAIDSDYPIVISMNVYNSFYDLEYGDQNTLAMPQESDEIIGGHAVTLVGYDLPRKLLLARNSFGVDWGDNGYFWIPFDYAEQDIMDCWIFDIELK
jgi:C1A family cysteine protease